MNTLLPTVASSVVSLAQEFDAIESKRKPALNELSTYMLDKISQREGINLNFICTHNSRRSHIAQLWAQAAAYYYGIENVHCFSGGTEATAFNPRAVQAMRVIGFDIRQTSNGSNPVYEVTFAHNAKPLIVFSKRYDDDINPANGFSAVMVCSDADINCPVVTGMDKKISLPYDDPKMFDGTSVEHEKYMERAREIGRDILYCFSQLQVRK